MPKARRRDPAMHPVSIVLLLLAFSASLVAQGRPSPFSERDAISGKPPLDDDRRARYSKYLAAMGESNLPTGGGESYRFLWLRSFHPPIAVRISAVGSQCVVVAKQLDGAGGNAAGRLARRIVRTLPAEACAPFRGLLGALDFWRSQPSDASDRNAINFDGAQWVLEGRRGDGYHVWDVWSPSESGPHASFRSLCVEMIRLSGLTLNPTEVY